MATFREHIQWGRVGLILALPFFIAGLAQVLYATNGFGGGHGRADFVIGFLGLPAIMLLEARVLPMPEWVWHVDAMGIIWYPAIWNLLLVWLPLASFFGRRRQL